MWVGAGVAVGTGVGVGSGVAVGAASSGMSSGIMLLSYAGVLYVITISSSGFTLYA